MTIPNDPESEGIPDIADDDSTAYDDRGHRRFDNGPPYLPAEEAVGVDDYGVTAYEGTHGEPLQARLVREEPDLSPDEPETAPTSGIADEALTADMLLQASRDADIFDTEDTEDAEDDEEENLGYVVGRIVEMGEGGSFEDDEAESIAYDSGEFEGQSAEEAAMHLVREKDIPYE